jgi:hypothetical protein
MIDARITKVGAEVYLTGVREARNIALTYAYWSRRNDVYKYLSYGHAGFWPYSSWGFGYPINWR